MAASDSFGQPTWADSDPVNLAVDLTAAADAVGHGPVRVGTQAERLAADAYEGLRWVQTDAGGGEWVHDGTEWLPAAQVAQITATSVVTVEQNWSRLLSVGTWSVNDPHGLVEVSAGGSITLARSGVYRITGEVQTNFGSSARTMMLAFFEGASTPTNLPNSAESWGVIGASGGSNGGQVTLTRRHTAGTVIAPWIYASAATQRQAPAKNVVVVERITP